jgi:hypothetical protein
MVTKKEIEAELGTALQRKNQGIKGRTILFNI